MKSAQDREKESTDIYEQIMKYKQLLDNGAITEDEFELLKSKLIK